jgi:hypothetical protein
MTMQQALETAYNDWNKQKNAQQDTNITQEKQSIPEEMPDFINNSQSVITSTELSITDDSISNFKNTTEIPFYYGNPSVDLVNKLINYLVFLGDLIRSDKVLAANPTVGVYQWRS